MDPAPPVSNNEAIRAVVSNEKDLDLHHAETRDEKVAENERQRIMPEGLRAMSEEDRNALEKKIVRKIDLVIMPIVAILYILNFLDRANLGAAKLQGIMTDLHLSTQQFAACISLLYVGYLPFQIPSNLIIARVSRPGLYICIAVITWGAISLCTAAVHNFSQLVGVRVVLGAVEAIFFPGVIYFLSAWYTRPELGKRLATLFMGQQLGNAFGGLIAAGVLKLDGRNGLRGWRWLFIVEGSVTVGFGIIFAFFLPEYPINAKRLLNPVERDLAVWRLEQEAGAAEGHDDTGTWEGFRMALRDPKIWTLVLVNFWSQGMGSIINFFPTVVQSLGYNSIDTLLLTAPPYIFAIFVFYGLTWLVDRNNKIYITLMCMLAVSVVAFVIAIATLNIGARYFAMMLIPSTAVGPQIFLIKTINIHVARPYKKRAAAVAMVNSIGGLANLWTSYLYYAPPHLYAAFGANFGMAIAMMLILTAYRWHVRRENKMLDAGGAQALKAMKNGVSQQQMDLGWRYVGY
ncbi:uncharacterized protein I303_106412 [Kwoniella dejecticola CBS 10117]|uniref:Nicotinamide mononucleotide permease n=1 Tax=Kwoniella dejecticola CBS 10117 TaxID=1296121 RepID=A0A1A5ZUS6_9TREE|nr:nicotinamide mononucleotide permease [Kwoniella dejecticola CBS 10117]OBR81559.1 nicotinamide mononucleotide permease [Kwoniella dejecticola CBS 10117]